ncbi:MAG TPA: hypothetical protein PKV92_08315, partial [Thermodesulfovibrio thiophilus]|nr:hypothetical protein [Thermodesulfovibrio thiophilus]
MADNTIKITALLNTEDLEKKLLHIQGTLTQLVNNLNNAFSANTFLLKDFFGYMDKNVTQYINAFTRLSRMMETSFAPSVRKAIGVMKLSPEDVSSYSNMAQDLVKNARLINQIFGASPQVGFFSSSLKTQLADFEKLKKDIDIMQEVSRRRISPSIFGDIYTGDVGKARFKADLEERKAMLAEYQKNISSIQKLQPLFAEAPKTGDILGRVTSYTSSLQTLRKEVEIMQRALEKGSPLEMLSERYAGVGGRDRFLEDLQSRQAQLAQLEKYQKQVSRFKDILAEPIPIGRFKASADEYIATINKLNSDISVMTRALEKNAPLRVFGEQFAGREGRELFKRELQERQQQLQEMVAPKGLAINLARLKTVGADISDVPLRYVQGWSKVLVLNEKLKKATQELITNTKSATFNWANIATRAVFLVSVLGAVFTALDLVKRGFTEGIRAIEDYRVSIAKFTGLTVTFTTPKEGEAFSTHLAKATVYAEKLYEFMQDIAAETLLNNEQAQLMAQSFLQAGIIIDTTSEKQKEAVKSIGNAILILTKGQQGSVQIVQELRDLFVSGMITSRDMLGVLLRAIDP